MEAKQISIVWLKKDLRLQDHLPLHTAMQSEHPILFLYCFEPSIMQCPESAARHWRFAWECVEDLQRQLNPLQGQISIAALEVINALQIIQAEYQIEHLFSYEEVGLKITFDRDKAVKKWCQSQGITYREFPQNGTLRGKQHRIGWVNQLEQGYFMEPPITIDLAQLKLVKVSPELRQQLMPIPLPHSITTYQEGFQQGGSQYAQRYFQSFLKKRIQAYSKNISKPQGSRMHCSRLSPYLAFGCISVREVYQAIETAQRQAGDDWNLDNFKSRLWWRSHYIQKLETDWRVEFEPINKVFKQLDRATEGPILEAWKVGQTGFPMVDASMRCLKANGWINFRMRAMLMTFASFGLWIHFRPLAEHLAQLFLDFDPGIHYPQIQMQAGLTGYHTLRIFNPTIQVRNHDQEGIFIKKWVPELRDVPANHLAEPWKMTAMEQTFYNCQIGRDYPSPIVDYDLAVSKNKDRYWVVRQSIEAKRNLPAIWRKFCIPKDIEKYQKQEDVCNFGE